MTDQSIAEAGTESYCPIPTATNFFLFTNNVSFNIAFMATMAAINPKDPTNAEILLKSVSAGTFAMSPQLAKELSNVLKNAVTEYENQYGEIPSVRTRL